MLGNEASEWYHQRRREALRLAAAYEDARTRIQQAADDAGDAAVEARTALAGAYLPELGADALARVAKLTGFRGFERRDPLKAMAHEAVVLRRRIQTAEADERYQRRRWLVGEHGELTRGRAEAMELLEPWEASCSTYEDLDGFLELIEVRYDTPEFSTPFWEPAYWRQWAAGDRICEALGVEDFGDDVLPEYTRVAAERGKWRAEVASWDARIQAVHDVVQARDQAEQRLQTLPERFHEGSVRMLAKFLEHADPTLLEQWAAAESPVDRGIQMGLRRLAGLVAKRDMLGEIAREGLAPAAAGFQRRAEKYSRKSAKFSRSKWAWQTIPDSHLDHKFVAKQAKYAERLRKLEKLVGRIVAYEDYQRFTLSNPPELWWGEMTGKAPGGFTPGLRLWYARHGHRTPELDRDFDPGGRRAAKAAAAVAVATVATAAAVEQGYLS